MRIGVVAYEMEGQPTGVGRYLEGLLGGAAELDETIHWHLFFKGDPFDHPLWHAPPNRAAVFEPHFDHRPTSHPILWEQLRLPSRLRRQPLDLLFSPGYSLPEVPGLPKVVTLHDLSFEHLGDEFGFKERWRRRLLARRAAKTARRVLADTQTIARDLRTTYGLAREKVEVVPLGLDPRFSAFDPARAVEGALAELGLDAPYLLALGSILPRRRLDLVIEGFAQLAPRFPELELVLAGSNRLRHRHQLDLWIAESGIGPRIRRLGWVDDALLPTLYARARAVIYLSTYEGYGLPPLEALVLGTPTVTSPGLALDDLWPEAPHRLATLDRDAFTTTLGRLLADPEAARQATAPIVPRLRALDWPRAAQDLVQVLRAVVAESV